MACCVLKKGEACGKEVKFRFWCTGVPQFCEDKTEREGPLPVAKASLDGAKSTEGSSRPSASRSQGTAGPNPVTQSAKQFADAFSREVLKIDRERVNKNTKPRFQESIRIMPTSAWSKLYAAFPARATSPVKPEATASTQPIQSIPSKSAEVSAATVHKALHSIVPAQWSSFHRHWTCQKTVAEMIAIVAIPEIRNSDAVAVATVASLASASLAKMAAEAVTKAVTKEISMVFSSASPAMWSPLHRKWCGHEVLKQSLKQSLKPSKAPKAIQKLALAKDYGLLPGLASSMLDAALNIEVKAITNVLKAGDVFCLFSFSFRNCSGTNRDCGKHDSMTALKGRMAVPFDNGTWLPWSPEAEEVSKALAPMAPIVKCSVAPAIYSKWHRHWTGGRASWTRQLTVLHWSLVHDLKQPRFMDNLTVVVAIHGPWCSWNWIEMVGTPFAPYPIFFISSHFVSRDSWLGGRRLGERRR